MSEDVIFATVNGDIHRYPWLPLSTALPTVRFVFGLRIIVNLDWWKELNERSVAIVSYLKIY